MIMNDLVTAQQILDAFDDLVKDIYTMQDIVEERLDEIDKKDVLYKRLQEIYGILEDVTCYV